MKRTVSLVGFMALFLQILPNSYAVDLSDTKRPTIKVRAIAESGLPSDVLSVEIEYSDDKNLLRSLSLPFQIERAVQDLEAAPICKMNVFSLPLQYLSKGEDLSKRQVTQGSVKQIFILRYLNQIAKVDNGCPYSTKSLINGWGFWPFDEPLLTLDMADEAGNRVLWDGVATATGSLSGNTNGQIAKLPFDLSIKKMKSVCDPQLTAGRFNCDLAQRALHSPANRGLRLEGYDLEQIGFHAAILEAKKSLGNFNEATYSFESWNSSVGTELRIVVNSILAVNDPRLPSLEDSSISAATKRYVAYRELIKLADLAQSTNIVSLWNSWFTSAKADIEAKARAEAEAKARAEAEAKAKAEAEAKAKAELAASELAARELAEKPLCEARRKELTQLGETLKKYIKSNPGKSAEIELTVLRLNSALNSSCVAEVTLSDFQREATELIKSSSKKTTITCLKGKTIKKVTAVKPKCPKGYKKK